MDIHALTAENDQLKRCVANLSGILAVEGASKVGSTAALVARLLETLLTELDLKLVCLRLEKSIDGLPQETLKTAGLGGDGVKPGDLGPRVFTLPLGTDGDLGLLTVGAARNDFPLETEHFILDVAGTKIANALLNAFHANERQRLDAERAHYKENLLLRSMVDSIAAPLGFFKPTGELEVVNRLVLDYFGMTFEELSNWDNIVHPADLAASRAAWNRALESEEAYEHEARIRRADGTYRWNDHRGYPMRDAEGRIVRWCVLQTDIHDRKEAEARLAASERNLNEIINSIPAMAWSASGDGAAEFLSQHYLDYVGLPLDQMQGANWALTIHPDDTAHLIGAWQRMVESRSGSDVEARVRRSDGEYRWFLFRTNPIHDAAGNVVRWFGVNTDIEDLKRAEAALRGSELNLRRQTETIPQMLWSAGPDGAMDYCNARYLDYTGSAARAVMGDGWKDAIHPDDREATARAWRHSVSTGEPYQVELRKYCAAAGEYHWCLTTALPLRDEDGRIVKWHGASVDMHDWKRAQDELRETQSELAHMTRVMTMGQLTASIAHELNQPLAGIMTNAGTGLRMLTANPPNVEGARETARRTIRDAKRASEVITRLRALFARRTTSPEIVDLNTAVQEVIALSMNELQRSNVGCRVHLADNLPYTMGDRVQLQQVILNFILNGAEAMASVVDRPKELVVSTEIEETGHLRVSVRDVGVGFDPAMAEKLFSPFYTTKSVGMGIGLSVSRTIVENHQGRLWAECNEGPGAKFSFSIPSTLAPAQASPSAAEAGNA